jgi:hypothetical protein
MKPVFRLSHLLLILFLLFTVACATNPYAVTNRAYKKQVKALVKPLKGTPIVTPGTDSIPPGDYWVGTTNFNLRKPNYVVIHHTAQQSTAQTLRTFTLPKTQVSAHYVIGRDGKVYHMLNDYLRAWHGGAAKWGNNTDLNSSSIGIELDNNGTEPFAEPQIKLTPGTGLAQKELRYTHRKFYWPFRYCAYPQKRSESHFPVANPGPAGLWPLVRSRHSHRHPYYCNAAKWKQGFTAR